MKESVKENLDLEFVIVLIIIQIVIITLINNNILICNSWKIYFIPIWLLIPCQSLGMLLEIKIGKES